MKALLLLLAAASTMVYSGCTTSRTVYARSQVNQAHRIEMGTVIGVRRVVIDGQANQIGRFGGGATGAIAGSQVGHGVGSQLAGVAGGIAGMVVGEQVQKAVTREAGLEITLLMDDGSEIVVVQEEKKGGFQDGDRVRVMMGQGTTYVLH